VKASFPSDLVRWRLVGPHAVLFLVVFFVFTVGGFFLWSQATTLQEQATTARRQLAHLQGEIRHERDSLRLAEHYQKAYTQLRRHHLVGSIDRLQVIEVMDRVRRHLQIPEMLYRFDPERVEASYLGVAPQQYRFHVTPHLLQFSVRDETELLGVLEQLRNPLLGFHLVESCTMSRRKEELSLEGKGNINGKCRLAWLSLQPPDPVAEQRQGENTVDAGGADGS